VMSIVMLDEAAALENVGFVVSNVTLVRLFSVDNPMGAVAFQSHSYSDVTIVEKLP